MTRALWLAALLATGVAAAQDRPGEAELFGAPEPADGGERPSEDALFGSADGGATPRPENPMLEADKPGLAPESGATLPRSRDEEQLSGPAATSRFETGEEKEDPLKVGGMLYLRTAALVSEGDSIGEVGLSSPNLMDAYFDARPSDRVRGMLLARLQYDPTLAPGEAPSPLADPDAPVPANPSVALDQLWIRFDIAHHVFVTAGKQHVKWGASRFWNPTDFLTPQKRNPLDPFDARLGATMLKVHVPWEERGWNFYAIGLLDNAGPANTLGELGGAVRAEVVLGQTEVGAEGVFVGGQRPRVGIDLSSAVGPVDVYGEVALRDGADFQAWTPNGEVNWNNPLSNIQLRKLSGLQAQASGGLTYTFNYTDQNALTVGAEYFYNPVGVSSRALYPWLIFQNQFVPFYVGQHYVAVYALAAGLPGNLTNVTLSLSNVGNLSDRSFLSRADAFIRVLSFLSVELFAAGHYGATGGEFKFALDLPQINIPGSAPIGPIQVPPPIFELGAGLRVSL
ncbi:MAG: hypothetical protein ACYC8T_13600 [Myxococcaceae bacterium]